MRNFSLKCFGVGDGWPSAERGHSAYLYRFARGSFLVDCGEPISRSFKASGYSYDLMDHLFLSHLHFDHAGGFFMFMQSLWLEGRSKDLTVHAPTDGIEALRRTLRAGCIFEELLPFRFRFEPLTAGTAVQLSGVRVTPFGTTHLEQMRKTFHQRYPQEYAAFCFLIESADTRIAHSADIGAAEDLLPLLQGHTQLLVCELAHVPPQELFQFLRGREIERTAFVHLSRECRRNLDALREEARNQLRPMQVLFPEDGDEFVW